MARAAMDPVARQLAGLKRKEGVSCLTKQMTVYFPTKNEGLQRTEDDIVKEIDQGLASLEKEARGWLGEARDMARQALREIKRRPP